MSDTPRSYVNMYRNKGTGEEFAGTLRFADRGYAEYVGNFVTDYSEYLGTVPSDDEPDNHRTFDHD